MSVDDLKSAFMSVDPDLDPKDLIAYIAWAFNTTEDKLDSAEPVEQSNVLERLQNGNVYRSYQK